MDTKQTKKTKNKKRIVTSIWLVIFGIFVILWFIFRGFFFDQFIIPFGEINLEKSAQFGDFIGGFVGAIFTLVGIVLLYETLSLQRHEFEESRQVFQTQQFENKFFSLLSVYKDIIAAMHYDVANSSKVFVGKEYFVKHKEDIFQTYQPTDSMYKNRKIAIDIYTNFYISNKETIAHYFRTLYRIFKLIHETDYGEKNKMSYAKIVRAQLSESELFFINYNACTPYGEKFRELIVDFNVTKHLPLLEKIEFKAWRNKLTDEKANSINFLFEEIFTFLKSSDEKFYKTYLRGRFAILIKKEKTKINLTLTRNNNQSFNNYLQEGYGLDDFTNQEIETLLKFWAIETFSNRNYNLIHEPNHLNIKVDTFTVAHNKYKIQCLVETKNNQELKIK